MTRLCLMPCFRQEKVCVKGGRGNGSCKSLVLDDKNHANYNTSRSNAGFRQRGIFTSGLWQISTILKNFEAPRGSHFLVIFFIPLGGLEQGIKSAPPQGNPGY